MARPRLIVDWDGKKLVGGEGARASEPWVSAPLPPKFRRSCLPFGYRSAAVTVLILFAYATLWTCQFLFFFLPYFTSFFGQIFHLWHRRTLPIRPQRFIASETNHRPCASDDRLKKNDGHLIGWWAETGPSPNSLYSSPRRFLSMRIAIAGNIYFLQWQCNSIDWCSR